MPNLSFQKITINSFAGIDKENPVIIFFADKDINKKITKFTGDMGVGKSSVINAMLYSAAHHFDFGMDNFINKKDNTISEEVEFSLDKKKYKVKATKSKFELLRLFRDGDEERWITENSPKTLVKELIKVGYSPMELKGADGKAQMAWFYSMVQPSKEILEKEEKLKEALKTAETSRTDSNREYTNLKKFLSASDLYNNWEESEKKYSEEKDATALREKYEKLQKEVQLLANGEGELIRVKDAISKTEAQIEELQLSLAKLNERKEVAIKYLDENSGKRAEAKTVGDEYFSISSYLTGQKEWKQVVQKKKEMEEFETLVQDFDVKKDDLRQQLRDLASEIAPDIKGLQIVTDDSIDGKEMGIYIDEKTVAMLSESELWNFYMKLCKAKGVNLVLIENVPSLGTLSVDMINELAASGVYIFATEMKRGQKELKFELIDELK